MDCNDDHKQPHGAISELIDMAEDIPVVPAVFCIILGFAALIYSIYIH